LFRLTQHLPAFPVNLAQAPSTRAIAFLYAVRMSKTLADLIERRFGIPTETGRSWPATGALAQLLSHRVQRAFLDKPIEAETLRILFAAAFSAPSKSDLQQASVIVVRDSDKRRKVEALVPSMPWMSQAAELLVFCGDHSRIRRISELREKPFPNDTLDMFMNAAVDAALVMQGFITAAESIGLGCCPISVLRDEVKQLSAILEIPAGVFPVAGLCVGYPAREARFSMRLPLEATVHVDRYDATGFEEKLAAYDARRAVAEPSRPGSQRHADRYGEVTPYTWSEDKARQYSTPQRHSFGDYVRGQGFALK
jgi:nitroreductase